MSRFLRAALFVAAAACSTCTAQTPVALDCGGSDQEGIFYEYAEIRDCPTVSKAFSISSMVKTLTVANCTVTEGGTFVVDDNNGLLIDGLQVIIKDTIFTPGTYVKLAETDIKNSEFTLENVVMQGTATANLFEVSSSTTLTGSKVTIDGLRFQEGASGIRPLSVSGAVDSSIFTLTNWTGAERSATGDYDGLFFAPTSVKNTTLTVADSTFNFKGGVGSMARVQSSTVESFSLTIRDTQLPLGGSLLASTTCAANCTASCVTINQTAANTDALPSSVCAYREATACPTTSAPTPTPTERKIHPALAAARELQPLPVLLVGFAAWILPSVIVP